MKAWCWMCLGVWIAAGVAGCASGPFQSYQRARALDEARAAGYLPVVCEDGAMRWLPPDRAAVYRAEAAAIQRVAAEAGAQGQPWYGPRLPTVRATEGLDDDRLAHRMRPRGMMYAGWADTSLLGSLVAGGAAAAGYGLSRISGGGGGGDTTYNVAGNAGPVAIGTGTTAGQQQSFGGE